MLNSMLLPLTIPAALAIALIYGVHATWRDIQAGRRVWAGVGILTTLATLSALALLAYLFVVRWRSW